MKVNNEEIRGTIRNQLSLESAIRTFKAITIRNRLRNQSEIRLKPDVRESANLYHQNSQTVRYFGPYSSIANLLTPRHSLRITRFAMCDCQFINALVR